MKSIRFLTILYLILSLHMISFSQEISLKSTYQSETQKLTINNIKNEFTKKIEEIQEKLRNLEEFKHLLTEDDYMQIKLSNEIAIENIQEQLELNKISLNILLNEKELSSNLSQKIIHRANQELNQSSLKLAKTPKTENFLRQDIKTVTDLRATEAAEYASACLKGALASIPPSFCYKQNADFGVIPTDCPE